jgi:hypothetical protein
MKVTLQCCVCQARTSFEAGLAQMASLKESGAAFFHCAACTRNTYWSYPSHERIPGMDRRVFHYDDKPAHGLQGAYVANAPQPPVDQRPPSRGPRRVALALPVRVRGLGLDVIEEITTTSNVSKTGLYFLSEKPFHVGQELRVAMNYSKSATGDLEQRAQVVRIVPIPGDQKKGIGAKYV